MTQNLTDPTGAESWYRQETSDGLEQGDQLFGFPLLVATTDQGGTANTYRRVAHLIVITQSCDLQHAKVATVLTAQTTSLSDWLLQNPQDFERLENIRQGFDTSLYLLPVWRDGPHANYTQHERIVDFGNLQTVDIAAITSFLPGGARVSLASPAREHFSQAVARSFMRVGLPIDIPSFRLDKAGTSRESLSLENLPFEDNDDLIRERPCTLFKPLPVTSQKRIRTATKEEFYRLTTAVPDKAEVIGVGYTLDGAKKSLARQLLRHHPAVEHDERRTWIGEYLSID